VFEMLEVDGKYDLKKHTASRSINQNSYMHALFARIAKDTGEDDPEYIKHHFK
jgi:hypothetical protein